jgi:chromosome segregation ATPase
VRLIITIAFALTLLSYPMPGSAQGIVRLLPRADAVIARLKALRGAAKTLKGPAHEALAEGRATFSELSEELSRARKAQRERTEHTRKWADGAHDLNGAIESADFIRELEKRRRDLENAIRAADAETEKKCFRICGDDGCRYNEDCEQ